MTFQFSIPTSDEPLDISIEPGSSVIFVGANGGGKTRLAVYIEDIFKTNAHRISAHRALNLNPAVPKVNEKIARDGLVYGYQHESAQLAHRSGQRWHGKAATALLNDFDFLIQVLFAEYSNATSKTHINIRAGVCTTADATKIEDLEMIWERLLPNKKLHITGDDIQVSSSGSTETYSASEMSDGERAIFYMIGQTLVANPNSLLIIDEPELHVHRSIMAKLWDELEAARPDCAFVFITHDLEFAASRSAQKYVIQKYEPAPQWELQLVPEDTGFDEEITTLILGSRKPILFVEGGKTSLDIAIYRCCYPDWTIIPRGSCSAVIHSVVTMRANAALTRVTCTGIIDADSYSEEDKQYFDKLGVKTLPVSEIENIFLLPNISKAILESEGHKGQALSDKLNELKTEIFSEFCTDEKIEAVIVRHCKRRIDQILKKIDISSAKNIASLEEVYREKIGEVNIKELSKTVTETIEGAMKNQDLPLFLENYDNKGMLAKTASHLKGTSQRRFESWIARVLRNDTAPSVASAIKDVLPDIQVPSS